MPPPAAGHCPSAPLHASVILLRILIKSLAAQAGRRFNRPGRVPCLGFAGSPAGRGTGSCRPRREMIAPAERFSPTDSQVIRREESPDRRVIVPLPEKL